MDRRAGPTPRNRPSFKHAYIQSPPVITHHSKIHIAIHHPEFYYGSSGQLFQAVTRAAQGSHVSAAEQR